MSISSVGSTGYSPAPGSAGAARLDRDETLPRAGAAAPAEAGSEPGGSAATAQRTQPAPSIGSLVDIYL